MCKLKCTYRCFNFRQILVSDTWNPHTGRAIPSPGPLARPALSAATGGSRARVWGPHGEREAGTYNGGLGQSPHLHLGAEPLVRGSGGFRPLKLNAFLHYYNLRCRPIYSDICFFAKQEICRTLGAWPLAPGSANVHHTRCLAY